MNTQDPQPAAAAPGNAVAGPAPLSTLNAPPLFPRLPGETPRAFNAFMTFFQLGAACPLQVVADKLGQDLGTLKNWSSKFDWKQRLQAFNSGLLQQQAQAQAAFQAKQAADWAQRLERFREKEWDAAEKLFAPVICFLESFGDEELGKMTLAQVSRALNIASRIGRSALAGAQLPPANAPAISPAQQHMLDAVKRIYGQPAPPQP